ncbi:hypothetical protein JQ660_004695 [Escherichia coli]|nr:hypothetical protein [Escherichia coli]EHD5202162.1 hypothetical protein [Escherichia coli]EKF8441127.1 hypothetical protein [Escherichia coli]MCN6534760.1 hypothetical protein [Escherichia coli]HBD1443691.1 hypothetical protein [Escherichia coli]
MRNMRLARNCPPSGQDRKGPKAPIIGEVILKWSKLPPDERAKDSVIDYLHSLPSCQDDHHVTY